MASRSNAWRNGSAEIADVQCGWTTVASISCGGNDQNERATFRLSKLEDEPALTMTREEWDNVWKEWPHA